MWRSFARFSLWCVLVSLFVDAETSFCPTSGYPSDPAVVSVWTKRSESGRDIYRLGGEELLAKGYRRGAHDNDTFVVVLSHGPPPSCPFTRCALKLTSSEELDDDTIVYQTNDTPSLPGYSSSDEETDLYCVRDSGDCGADVPIFTFRKQSSVNAYAYSIDPSISIAGFQKDAKPLCYGWSDRTNALSERSDTTKHSSGCEPISTVINGEVVYQSSKDINFPLGSTATIHCESGFAVVGPTTLICTNFGWYPESALGNCVMQDTASTVYCGPFSTPEDGYVIYSAQGPGIYPSGTTAVLHCSVGSDASSATEEAKCENGHWSISSLGSCKQPANKCSQLPSVLNGQVEYVANEKGQFGVGATAKLRCVAGYVVVGVDSVICDVDGWMPAEGLGKCQLSNMQCITGMPMVLNGQVNYSQAGVFGPFPSGTQATLTCNAGFRVSGESTAVCSGQSWQPASFGNCVHDDSDDNSLGANCPFGLSPPFSGSISYSQGFPFGPFPSGATATLQCTTGFPQGATSSTCINGQWDPSSLGTCSSSVGTGATQCSVGLPVPSNGRLTYSSGSMFGPFSSGTVVSVSCDSGFMPSGPTSATCINSQWSPSTLGRCVKEGETQCSSGIAAPLNGHVTYSDGRTFAPFPSGTTATLICNTGYQPSGEITSRCVNGNWQPFTFSQCAQGGSGETPCLFGIGAPVNGRIHYSNGATWGPFPAGTSAGLVCYVGFLPSGATLSTCQNGQWAPTAVGQCTQAGGSGNGQCPAGLPTPFNGKVSYSNGAMFGPFPSGTLATLSCNFGYSPSGGLIESTCESGNWSPSSLAQCSAGGGSTNGAYCFLGPMTPANGHISYSNGMSFGPFPPGTVAMLTCGLGFTASGSTTSTCSNGAWSPSTMSQCIQGGTSSSCLTGVFPPLNGRVNYSNGASAGPFPPGTTVTISCNLGYTPSGTVTATCINGQFSPTTLGQCVQGSVGGIGLPAQCFGLVPPFNGQISYSQQSSASTYPSGTIATLICNLGFTVSGGSTASTCINGQWNPSTLGTCQTGIGGSVGGTSNQGQCLFALPSVANGNIRYSSGNSVGPFNSGTSATLMCNFGATPTGSTTSFCANGAWQPSSLGSCRTNGVNGATGSNVQCPAIFPVLEGQLSYSEINRAGMYRQGTVVVLTCSAGYSVSGLSTATCIGGSWMPFPGIGHCQRAEVPRSPFALTGNVLTYCPAQMPPLNGNVNYNEVPSMGSFPPGTVAKLQCNLGFTVSGPSLSACRDGMWSPQLGVCHAGIGSFSGPGSCVSLSAPRNGKIFYIQAGAQNANEVGTTAILNCEAGFVVSGQAMLTCTAEGWTPQNGFGICRPAKQLL